MKSALLFPSLIFAFGVASCGQSSTGQNQSSAANASSATNTQYAAPDSNGIETLTVKKTAIPEYLDVPAHIEPDPTRVVHVFAPAGGRIVEMRVRPWDHVQKGQTLALLESSDLARAVADYHKALVDNQVKQKQLIRSQDLLDHKAISEREFQQAQADAQQAQAEVEAAREQIQVFGIDPDHASTQLSIKAPRAGVILDIGAAAGEFSQALSASAPLCTIADISTVWAVGDIYENNVLAAKAGEKAVVTLNAYPDQRWEGRVSVISSAVDPVTRTLHVRIVLPNPDGRFKPEMFGSIQLLQSSTNGILVPTAAVVREGDDSYVYVGNGNGHFQRRNVKLGRAVDGTLEIVSGLNAGETIVSQGALFLRAENQG